MKTSTIKTNAMPNAPVGETWDEVSASFDWFCLAAGIETLGAMMGLDWVFSCSLENVRDRLRIPLPATVAIPRAFSASAISRSVRAPARQPELIEGTA